MIKIIITLVKIIIKKRSNLQTNRSPIKKASSKAGLSQNEINEEQNPQPASTQKLLARRRKRALASEHGETPVKPGALRRPAEGPIAFGDGIAP